MELTMGYITALFNFHQNLVSIRKGRKLLEFI